MHSERLKKICSWISPIANVIDIGTDHAFLPIMLCKQGNQKIIASDIHPKVLENARKNIQSYHLEDKINLVLSDGLQNIDTTDYDTLVIAGMGTSTIIKILEQEELKLKPIKTIIIQSNNDHELLRKYMQQQSFKIAKEWLFTDKKIDYCLILYERGQEKLLPVELAFGKYQKENYQYYQKQALYYEYLLKQIPSNQIEKRNEIIRLQTLLNKYL